MITSRIDLFLVFSSGGMMLCCFYTCTAFLLAALSHDPLPLFRSSGMVFLAALLTLCHHDRGWRRIQVACLHAAGLIVSGLWFCHGYFRIDSPILDLAWVRDFSLQDHDAVRWLGFIIVAASIGILWGMGRRLITRPREPAVICRRFDLGLGSLLGLLTIKLLVAVKGAAIPFKHSSITMMTAFVLLGLISLGVVRIRNSPRDGAVYLKGAGIVMSFCAAVLGLGGGLFLLFLAELRGLADAGASMITTAAAPLGPKVADLIRFVFNATGGREPIQLSAGGNDVSVAVLPGESQAISQNPVMGITITILVLAGAFILYYAVKWLGRLLFARTEKKATGENGVLWLLRALLRAVGRFLLALRLGKLPPAEQLNAVQQYYRRLRRWGRFSGLHAAAAETPREFGMRLVQRFPQVHKEVDMIIHMHNEAVYGRVFPDHHGLAGARRALRRIRRPSLYPARLKSFFFQERSG